MRIRKRVKLIAIEFMILLFYSFIIEEASAIEVVLKVAYSSKMPPFQFYSDDKPQGIHVDVLNEIAKNYNFVIEYIRVDSTNKALRLLNDGEVDLVMGAFKGKSSEMTDSISQSSVCMISKKSDASHFRDNNYMHYSVAMEHDILVYSISKNINFSRYLIVDSEVRALNALLSGKSDVLIGVKDSIIYQLREKGEEDNYTIVTNYMMPIEYAFAAQPGDEDLVKKLNKGLYELRLNGNYEKIYKRWINEDNYLLNSYVQKTIVAGIIVIIIILIIIKINYILKHQVDEKTKELLEINNDLKLQIIETKNQSEIRNLVIENSNSSIIVFNKDYIIGLCNKNAYKLFNTDTVIGRNALSFDICKYVLEDKKEKIFSEIFNIVNNEFRYTINDDGYFRYNIFQLYDNNQNVRGIILSIEDISQEIKIKNEVIEKDKNNTLNKIIASIAHEIRNPLMSIKMFAELMPIKANDNNFQQQMVQIVPKEVDRVNNLIEGLIDYAKPRNNNKGQVLVNEIIDYCAMLIIPLLDRKRISIKVEYEEKISITINKDQLKQVVINLLINSLESLMEKQEKTNEEKDLFIEVRLWKSSNVVYLEIFDEGLGMSPQQVKKCMNLFFTTKSNGTGIGLALAKQFVESNNGKILIESKEYEFTKITIMFGGYDCV